MKVAIITIMGLHNYGNRLQAYAVQQVLKREGFNPVTLEITNKSVKQRAKTVIKHALGRPATIDDLLSSKRIEAFLRFNSRIVTRSTTISAIRPEDYACFISGSDQVWNPHFMRYRHPEFLGFAPKEKRIALAASIGISSIPKKDEGWFTKGIAEFARISVREERAAEIVRQLIGRDVEVVIDPTLALRKDEWLNVSDDRLNPSGSYVFTYFLGGINEDARLALSTVARGMPIVSLTDMDDPGELPAGPAEFISLLANASHVLTDSFHASIFAMLMGVPLTIVRRIGNPSKDMFSRMESLAKMLDLEKNIYSSPSYEPKRAGDFERSYELLGARRAEFDNYLARSLATDKILSH